MVFKCFWTGVAAFAGRIQHPRIVHVGRLSGTLRANRRTGGTLNAERIGARGCDLASAIRLENRSIDASGAEGGVGSAGGAKRISAVCDLAAVENTCTKRPVLRIGEGLALPNRSQVVQEETTFADGAQTFGHQTSQAVRNRALRVVGSQVAITWSGEVGDGVSTAVAAVEVVLGTVGAIGTGACHTWK